MIAASFQRVNLRQYQENLIVTVILAIPFVQLLDLNAILG